MSRVVEAVAKSLTPALRKVADHGIVRIDDEGRVLGKSAHGVAPALRDDLELAVAVELVPEEVPERNGPRPRTGDRLR